MVSMIRNGLLCTLLCSCLLSAAAEDGKGQVLRPEVGKPIQAAVEALKARKSKEALAKAREAEAVNGKFAYESYIVVRIKGQAAAAAGESATAVESLEATVSSALLPESDRAPMLATLAGQYYLTKNYIKAADTCDRYAKAGGNDPALRALQIQSLYLGGDYSRALKEIQSDVLVMEQEGKTPSEQTLQIAADIAGRQKNSASLVSFMEKLVLYYPKQDYWLNLVYSVSTMPGLSQNLTLDIYRLKMATGTLRTSEEYVEATQYALQAGFPVEAKNFIDAGYAAKLLGAGADAERHKRLRDTTDRKLKEDLSTLGQDDGKAAQMADGELLLNAGLNYVMHGKRDKGLTMMAEAFKKGGFKRLEEAKLHLGMAQYLSGQKSAALETLRTVRGNGGTAELARLWMLLAQR